MTKYDNKTAMNFCKFVCEFLQIAHTIELSLPRPSKWHPISWLSEEFAYRYCALQPRDLERLLTNLTLLLTFYID